MENPKQESKEIYFCPDCKAEFTTDQAIEEGLICPKCSVGLEVREL